MESLNGAEKCAESSVLAKRKQTPLANAAVDNVLAEFLMYEESSFGRKITYAKPDASEVESKKCMYNTVPLNTAHLNSFGILPTDIAPATYDNRRNPTAGYTCEPEIPSVIRGVRKKPPPSQDH
ncbi:hypothetical protein TNCV_4866111 [Trichonephila clavipes]|nr:hypothetical protein TNCV_4866111 [Trichonephila clavipes]